MGRWLKADVTAAKNTTDVITPIIASATDMGILVHSITSAADKNIIAGTKATVIGMIMARGKNIDQTAIETVYNTAAFWKYAVS